MKDQTVLVTGGTGFVGIHTIVQLLQQEYTVKNHTPNIVQNAKYH